MRFMPQYIHPHTLIHEDINNVYVLFHSVKNEKKLQHLVWFNNSKNPVKKPKIPKGFPCFETD